MPDNEESIDHIPPIVPARDEVASRQSRKSKRPANQRTAQSGGAGLWARLAITLSLVVAAVACAWAWQLQLELANAALVQSDYEARISDLEDRLSDTDEGMNQSSAAMAVKIKELYSEVDKLWASAWRRNKAKIEELEKSASGHDGQLAGLLKTDKDYSAQLKSLGTDVSALKSVAGDLERLMKTASASESQMEKLSDSVNRMTLDLARLEKRVSTNEEWVESINGFRKQVNRSLAQLQSQLTNLQGSGPAPPAAQ